MFELALCVNDVNLKFLERRMPKFREQIRDMGGIFNIHRDSKNIFFLIAVEKKSDKILRSIATFICDTICESFKRDFFTSNLRISCGQRIKDDALIEALVNYDRITDDEYILSRLKLGNEFYISSFYIFRLKELKQKWEKLLQVTNESAIMLSVENVYIEVMRYLMDGIEIGGPVTIEKINSTYVTKLNGGSKALYKINSQNELLNFLIKYNPKEILVKSMDDETLNFISKVFGKVVQTKL